MLLRWQLLKNKDMEKEKKGIGFFERYLTEGVACCLVVGIAIGEWVSLNMRMYPYR